MNGSGNLSVNTFFQTCVNGIPGNRGLSLPAGIRRGSFVRQRPGKLFSCQIEDQALRVLSFQEARILVKSGSPVKDALFVNLPLRSEGTFTTLLGDHCLDPEKRSLDKGADFPLSADDHAKYAGHDPADGDDSVVCPQCPAHCVAVAQGEGPGKIDAHEVVFLSAQIGCGSQIVIGRGGLCLPDSAQDLFLCLRIDPDSEFFFALYAGLRGYQTVDILALTPGVRADVDGLHLRVGQDAPDDPELFFYSVDDLVFVFLRNKGDRGHGPPLQGGVIGIGIGHGHQVTDAPGDYGILRFHISVRTAEVFAQSGREGARHTGLFRYKNCFRNTGLLSVYWMTAGLTPAAGCACPARRQ